MPPRASETTTNDRVFRRALVNRRGAASTEAGPLVAELLADLRKYLAWSKGFPTVLARAQRAEGPPPGYVWQDEFVEFWQPFDAIQKQMFDLADSLQLVLEDTGGGHLWKALERDLDPPNDAQLEFAMQKMKFVEVAGGQSRIAYQIQKLQVWHRNLTKWVLGAIRHLEGLYSKL